ncbi:MAG: TonB-dependent receptor [Cyclobacteriaceae bacterium]|nr:TonB-dependent receptor [Cyclobacteriaceae bacterium]
MKNSFVVLTVLLCTVSASLYAQDQGEIPNVEIVIRKDRQITLPPATRTFEKVPPRPVEPIKPEITYDFRNISFTASDYNPSIRPHKLKSPTIDKLNNNYISAGFGNYTSPYLEGYITNKRDKNKYYGAKFFHRSFGSGPVGDGNSASGNTEVSVFGKAFSRVVAVGGAIGYENRAAKFYGVFPGVTAAPIVSQSYSIINLSANVENVVAKDFNYNLTGGFSYLKDDLQSSETEISLDLKSNLKVANDKFIDLAGDYTLMNRDFSGSSRARHLFRVMPSYTFSPIENLQLKVGLTAAFQNDTIGSVKNVNLYPDVRASYNLTENIQAYAGLTGGIDRVSLHTLSRKNAWIAQNVLLNHTNRTFEFLGGLNGKLGSNIAFQTGLSFATLKNLYFYQNDLYKGLVTPSTTNHPERFLVTYDDATRTNLFAELAYSKTALVRLSLRGDYFAYSTDKIQKAWHRPAYKLNFSGSYNIYNKIQLIADLTVQGGIKANSMEKDNASSYVSTTVDLPVATDLNLKVSYSLSEQVHMFIQTNNVLGSQYQTYLYYPVRGFQALAGFSWSF